MLKIDEEPVIYLSVWRFYFMVFLVASGFFGWGYAYCLIRDCI